MKALIARKIGMSQIFGEDGKMTPVTLLEANPSVVTQLMTVPKDGYGAIQLGYGDDKKPNKPQAGHLKASKSNAKVLKEFKLGHGKAGGELKIGDSLDVSQFTVGDKVVISAVSKGKGFAGTIKRYNFHRGPMTHGSRSHRRLGSIGSMYPQKVFKGKKMPGRMGADKVTLKKVPVMLADTEKNVLAVKGPVPGPKKGYVLIKG